MLQFKASLINDDNLAGKATININLKTIDSEWYQLPPLPYFLYIKKGEIKASKGTLKIATSSEAKIGDNYFVFGEHSSIKIKDTMLFQINKHFCLDIRKTSQKILIKKGSVVEIWACINDGELKIKDSNLYLKANNPATDLYCRIRFTI